jgi:hypothetical protein
MILETMRIYCILAWILVAPIGHLAAQRACSTAFYQQNQITNDPALASRVGEVETFIQHQLANRASGTARLHSTVIRVPVVVHILYHLPGENISNEKVFSQIEMLNRCFRRKNADTANTPLAFRSVAADCEIEFQLATSDPRKRNTNGIIRKYTPIADWQADDKMKSSSEMGDDAWDASSYLNIWVCNLRKVAGYSSIVGGNLSKDGIVIDYSEFGYTSSENYGMGKTAVHETGHWLSLRHIWGDSDCGDDFVNDTPRQSSYNLGCPTGIQITCGNGPNGDMYMNYMDYTSDGCINMFTDGQKARMRTLFAPGGLRYAILASTGLNPPLLNESPLPDEPPTWLHPQVYPNPAANQLTLDIAYDVRWIGKTISIFDVNGHLALQFIINGKVQELDISKLRPGMYFLSAKKEDGAYIKQKFIKM